MIQTRVISGILSTIRMVGFDPFPCSEELFSDFSLGKSDKVYFQKSDSGYKKLQVSDYCIVNRFKGKYHHLSLITRN